MTEKKRYTTGQKSLREFRMEQERGKLRFLERVQQEKEADDEITSFSLEQQDKEKELPLNDDKISFP